MFYTCFLCACLFAFFVCLFVFWFLPLFLRCICLFLFGICAFLCWLLTAGVFFSARSESRTISLPPGFWQTYIRLGYFKPFFAISSYFPKSGDTMEVHLRVMFLIQVTLFDSSVAKCTHGYGHLQDCARETAHAFASSSELASCGLTGPPPSANHNMKA